MKKGDKIVVTVDHIRDEGNENEPDEYTVLFPLNELDLDGDGSDHCLLVGNQKHLKHGDIIVLQHDGMWDFYSPTRWIRWKVL
jgi:hypothetical protein